MWPILLFMIVWQLFPIFGTELPTETTEDVTAKCNEDDLVDILAKIQVINPETVIKLALVDNLDNSCKHIDENLETIDDYYKICEKPTKHDLYLQLYKGVCALYKQVCETSPFQKSFQKIHKCVHELKNDYDDCGGPADWNENPERSQVCKAYKDICDCFYVKTAKVCGEEPANIMKQLIVGVVDSILSVKCDNVKDQTKVDEPMPETYIRKSQANIIKLSKIYTTAIVTVFVHLV